MDEPEDKDIDVDDLLKKPLDDDEDDLADGIVPAVKVPIAEEDDHDDADALADDEEGDLDDFGSDDYNAADND